MWGCSFYCTYIHYNRSHGLFHHYDLPLETDTQERSMYCLEHVQHMLISLCFFVAAFRPNVIINQHSDTPKPSKLYG